MQQVFPTDRAEWPEQKRQLEERLRQRRDALEKASNMVETAFLQGEIATIRWIIGGAEPVKREGVGSTTYTSPRPGR